MPAEKPIIITEEEATFEIYPRPPILTSLQAGWNGFGIAYMCQPAFEAPEAVTPRWHTIGIFTHGDRIIHAERKLGDKYNHDAVIGGDIIVNPANIPQKVAWDQEGDFIILGIETHTFARIVDEVKKIGEVELLPCFSTPDPLVYQIGLSLKNILAINPACGQLYAETMVTALSVHLMQYYSSRKQNLSEYTDGLSKYKLNQVIDYINAHLDKNLSLTELAELAQMSTHYFSQLFKQSTGIAPHQYVIHCRVKRAKELVFQGKISIAEIAQIVGFANQSHLNFHFKRLLGTTPKKILHK
jgi:AraC family transcriptional regulator